jgi:hypothetical protein
VKSYVHLISYLAELLTLMRNVSDRRCRGNQNTISFWIFFLNRTVGEIICEECSTAGQSTDDNITRRLRFTSWITKATDTHSEYIIVIDFRKQEYLRERVSILDLCTHCLSCFGMLSFRFRILRLLYVAFDTRVGFDGITNATVPCMSVLFNMMCLFDIRGVFKKYTELFK